MILVIRNVQDNIRTVCDAYEVGFIDGFKTGTGLKEDYTRSRGLDIHTAYQYGVSRGAEERKAGEELLINHEDLKGPNEHSNAAKRSWEERQRWKSTRQPHGSQ